MKRLVAAGSGWATKFRSCLSEAESFHLKPWRPAPDTAVESLATALAGEHTQLGSLVSDVIWLNFR